MKYLILNIALVFTSISVNAKEEVPFKIVTKCVDGYEWLFTYSTDKESKYVRLLDAEQVYKTSYPKQCSYTGVKRVK